MRPRGCSTRPAGGVSRAGSRPARLAAAAVLLLSLVGCAGNAAGDTAAAPGNAPARETLSGTITVFAAASLTATFTELATQFEAEHPDTTIALNFGGSSDLVTQIIEGAPADVFASANPQNMKKLTEESLIAKRPVDFASNLLTIAVPRGNPADIDSFADLAEPGVKTVVCAPQVPCGAATVAVEKATGVTFSPVSEESSVTDVLGKVSSGEADAGLVYVTDVAAAGASVDGIPFPESAEAVNVYPIGVLSGSKNAAVAQAFVDSVLSDDGQDVLEAAGFGAA